MRFKYFALFGLLAAFAVSACTQERVTYSEPLHHAPARTRDAAVSQAALSLYAEYETANYEQYADNPVKSTIASPLSTFSLNVATASYPNVRRFLESAQLPPENAVRTEELLNYFPAGRNHDMMRLGDSPFEVDYQLTPCPWNKKNVLFYLHLRALDPAPEAMPPANLVFLVDVSGSMNSNERLPMAKEALKALVNELRPEDKISIVTYSGNVRLALRSTSGEMKRKIRETIDELNASGSTAGGGRPAHGV